MPSVAIASDHAAVPERIALHAVIRAAGYEVLDCGPAEGEAVDYPDTAGAVARAVQSGEAAFGVLLCGSGIGMSIAANRYAGVRAALVSEPLSAALARQHNDANVLAMGARVTGSALMAACLSTFLREAFDPGDDGRHARRVAKLEPADPER